MAPPKVSTRVVQEEVDCRQRHQDGEHQAGLDDDVVDRHPAGVQPVAAGAVYMSSSWPAVAGGASLNVA